MKYVRYYYGAGVLCLTGACYHENGITGGLSALGVGLLVYAIGLLIRDADY